MPRDCKVTPVDCACQEGNTICCISSNDGLDADLWTFFPHWGGELGCGLEGERTHGETDLESVRERKPWRNGKWAGGC